MLTGLHAKFHFCPTSDSNNNITQKIFRFVCHIIILQLILVAISIYKPHYFYVTNSNSISIQTHTLPTKSHPNQTKPNNYELWSRCWIASPSPVHGLMGTGRWGWGFAVDAAMAAEADADDDDDETATRSHEGQGEIISLIC